MYRGGNVEFKAVECRSGSRDGEIPLLGRRAHRHPPRLHVGRLSPRDVAPPPEEFRLSVSGSFALAPLRDRHPPKELSHEGTVAITVALVLAIAALAAQAEPISFTKRIDGATPLLSLGNELQAKIQAAIADYERLPSWTLIIVAEDIPGTAFRLADLADSGVNTGNGAVETLRDAAAAYMNVRSAGEALDVLSVMRAAVASSLRWFDIPLQR